MVYCKASIITWQHKKCEKNIKWEGWRYLHNFWPVLPFLRAHRGVYEPNNQVWKVKLTPLGCTEIRQGIRRQGNKPKLAWLIKQQKAHQNTISVAFNLALPIVPCPKNQPAAQLDVHYSPWLTRSSTGLHLDSENATTKNVKPFIWHRTAI